MVLGFSVGHQGSFYQYVMNDSRKKASYMNGWTACEDLEIIQLRGFQTSFPK